MHMKDNVLALDAAFGPASACLLRSDGQCYHATGDEKLPHSQGILPLLEDLLHQADIHWRDLQVLATGIGPGSFTGLRVAAATMAGINTALKLPLLAISSLAITALQADAEDVWVLEDARSGDAYVGHYIAKKAVQPDSCLSWEEVYELPVIHFASQSDTIPGILKGDQLPLTHPRPLALAQLITLTLEDYLSLAPVERGGYYPMPAYVRPSQAERKALQADTQKA